MSDVSLYTINSFLILDNTGKRIYTKYYKPPHSSINDNLKYYNNQKAQLAFEDQLFQKTYKTNNDILLFENQIVIYKSYSDIIIYLVSPLDENESMLSTVFSGLTAALEILLTNSIDKRSLNENYDKLTLAVDETIDDGIVLEYDAAVIASRVSNAPQQDAPSLNNIDLSERGFMNAFSFAKAKFTETLQQGL